MFCSDSSCFVPEIVKVGLCRKQNLFSFSFFLEGRGGDLCLCTCFALVTKFENLPLYFVNIFQYFNVVLFKFLYVLLILHEFDWLDMLCNCCLFDELSDEQTICCGLFCMCGVCVCVCMHSCAHSRNTASSCNSAPFLLHTEQGYITERSRNRMKQPYEPWPK